MAEYITRESALMKLMQDGCNAKNLQSISDMPAVDVTPVVHGRFAHDGPRLAGGVDWWHCSNCGRLASGVEIRYDYCPWCGARMDGGAKDG